MSSFTSPGGVTVPLLPTSGLAPGTSLSIAPISNFTAPPVSRAPETPITYPVLQNPSVSGAPSVGAMTTVGAQGAPAPPANPQAAPAAAPQQTVAQLLAAQQARQSGRNMWARGGHVSGFADGGSPDDDMVMSDSGSYMPLSSLQAPDPAGITSRDLPPPDIAARPAPIAGMAAPPAHAADSDTDMPTPSRDRGAPAAGSQSGFADSPWLPVLATGLGIMGGRSPYASVNIGQGGLEGVKTLEGQQQRLDTRSEKQATIDQDANRLSELADYHKGDLDLRTAQNARQAEADQARNQIAKDTLAQQTKYQAGELGVRQQEANKGDVFYQGTTTDASGNIVGSYLDRKTGTTTTGPVVSPTKPVIDKSGPTIREWDPSTGWRDTGIATAAQDRVDAQNAAGVARTAQGQQKLNQGIDKSGPTVRQWDGSANNGQGVWSDTGTPTTAQERVDAQATAAARKNVSFLGNRPDDPTKGLYLDKTSGDVNEGPAVEPKVGTAGADPARIREADVLVKRGAAPDFTRPMAWCVPV